MYSFLNKTVFAQRIWFAFLLTAACCAGCYTPRTYYVSPYNGIHNTYQPIRPVSDSVKAGYYLSGTVMAGNANENERDLVYAFYTGASGSYTFKHLQAFYSLDVSAGQYKVGAFEQEVKERNYSMGSTGFEGGLNFVMPFAGGEWRVVGIETSVRKEFGNYLRFRQQLPNGIATVVVRHGNYSTLGGYTELVVNLAEGNTFGLRLSAGKVLGNGYQGPFPNAPQGVFQDKNLSYRYLNFVTHFTIKKYTLSFHFNGAAKAAGGGLGVAYRLNK